VSRSRAFLLHKLAADAGDLQSMMALAYFYFRQEVS
jgi:SEL1 protein